MGRRRCHFSNWLHLCTRLGHCEDNPKGRGKRLHGDLYDSFPPGIPCRLSIPDKSRRRTHRSSRANNWSGNTWWEKGRSKRVVYQKQKQKEIAQETKYYPDQNIDT